MYWSDWEKPAEIATSKMDGTADKALVKRDIAWPNGLALDYPNSRLYWVDAKLKRLESVKLDGSDRRIILDKIVKHPYAIAVFEDKLYWSDWGSHSIQSCNKFTGKNHTTIVKEKKADIYGIHIYHSGLKASRATNPCSGNICSHICLLSGSTYACACPEHKKLSSDNRTCTSVEKPQVLVAGIKNTLLKIEHQKLGKQSMKKVPTITKEIASLAYDPKNNTLYIYDSKSKAILKMNVGTESGLFIEENLVNITSLSMDYNGNNLYWCNLNKHTVEVLNLITMSKKILIHDVGDEVPVSLALVPEDGVMFVAFKKPEGTDVHIDRYHMDGSSRTHAIEEGILGNIVLKYDFDLGRVFWIDEMTGNIESTSAEGDDRHDFRELETTPMSITFLKDDLFWTNKGSKRLFWGNKLNSGIEHNKFVPLGKFLISI